MRFTVDRSAGRFPHGGVSWSSWRSRAEHDFNSFAKRQRKWKGRTIYGFHCFVHLRIADAFPRENSTYFLEFLNQATTEDERSRGTVETLAPSSRASAKRMALCREQIGVGDTSNSISLLTVVVSRCCHRRRLIFNSIKSSAQVYGE